MRFYPTRIHTSFVCFIFLSILLNFACSKDGDLLLEAVLDDESISPIEETVNDTVSEEENENPVSNKITENRTTNFSPIHDAHLQSGKGYNQSIIRLEENLRTSYLMFDLSPIAAIDGKIVAATLQLTINGDAGSGTINVNKAVSNDWTENNISDITAPEVDLELGNVIKEYRLGNTESIELNTANMTPEISTLVLSHVGGNDLAFASKEHSEKIGPKLVITYTVEKDSEQISDVSEQETTTEETTPEETTPEETTPEETTPEETTPEETTEEEQTNENEEPMAVADATPTSGGVPLEVNFTGSNSTDDVKISGYIWNFKDGASATEADPTHTFTTAGVYEVILTVRDEDGLSTTDTITITVTEEKNKAPNAVVSANITSGTVPLLVSFSGDKSTDDNSISSYIWNFKDGSTANSANTTHTFNAVGTYAVELIVKDENGLSSKEIINITVNASENQAPVALATANPTSGKAPLEVQFLGQSSTDDKGITSHFWDFKDGSTATSPNPSHSFTQPGSYSVNLTVKDAEGLSNTSSIIITVEEPSNTLPPGFYVATNGNSSNNGTSPSNPWSLTHAFNVARPGDIIYVKAGTYQSSTYVAYQSGSSSQPIKLIGYKNSPGDISSDGASTFQFGESVDPSKMPLILGNSSTSGIGLDLNGGYIHIENFQVSNYETGVNSKGASTTLKNVIVSNIGQQNNNSSNNGKGILVSGNSSNIENCFVLNSNSQGINIKGSSYSKLTNCKVYSNNQANPTGYYLLISNGSANNVVDNCTIYRDPSADVHRGHGLVLKDAATNNVIKNSKTYNTGIEVNFSGVHSNRFDNCSLNGSYPSDRGEFTSNIRILNGAHDNIFNNISISNSLYAVNFHDFDDGFTATNGDRDRQEGGSNNIFTGLKVNNVTTIISATSEQVGAQAFSKNNKFSYCTFENISSLPFVSFQTMTGTIFSSCTFKNIPSNVAIKNFAGGTFQSSFPGSSWSNVGFTPLN